MTSNSDNVGGLNSWSFLYDEILKMEKENTFTSGKEPMIGSSEDTDIISKSPGVPWKYNEEEIVKELLEYIRGTYKQHYAANDENIQTLDYIEAAHKDGEPFCRDNILKYTSRYDKKGTAERDILKIQHYSILLGFFYKKNATQRETYNQ
jgi:hypothetical protein|tara:strand:- start:3260 stop:3709 length:450 start_codon:yes stop_codon:yes gene_type:complete